MNAEHSSGNWSQICFRAAEPQTRCCLQTDKVFDEVNAYTAAETPEARFASLDALARRLDPAGSSRVAAIAELQKRGVLKAPGTHWTQPHAAAPGRTQKAGCTGCERGYLVRVTKAAGTAFYAVVTSTEDSALRAVRQAIRPGDRAAIMEHRLSPDRVKALRLRFGLATDVTRALHLKHVARRELGSLRFSWRASTRGRAFAAPAAVLPAQFVCAREPDGPRPVAASGPQGG
jgi:hypothetical protein